LRECTYPGYVYGYPHKKAYRALDRPIALDDIWSEEDRRHLFAYVHVPFCRQRCSFCNLFTHVPGDDDPTSIYLDALAREADVYSRVLEPLQFRRLYIGGGTPTYLDVAGLRKLLRVLRDSLDIDPAATQGCIEASPETVDADKVLLLHEAGFHRISLGVQSFVEKELREVNRRFDFDLHRQAIEQIGEARFPQFNIDLIYGLPGQTENSWRYSLERAIASPATSLFLYPLYVRPLTGLGNRKRTLLDRLEAPTTRRMAGMYDIALERLDRAGFRQLTMRQFRRDNLAAELDNEYSCQHDGMVGLGAGARSYTARLHYSTPWRMVARNIRDVIKQYQQRMLAGETTATHGFELGEDERRRRFVILSLLFKGVDTVTFARTFHANVRELFAPVWEALDTEWCIRDEESAIRLTPRGVRHADVVGQLFFSPRVLDLIETYEYDS
jgi:oxygen-independent coproporphyrinogen-3 oxidase